jgi:hypothetical protein
MAHLHNHDMAGAFTVPADARRFLDAGNATITVQSRRTGARFTYRVRKSPDGQVSFVQYLSGSDNERSYSYLGYVRRGVYFHGGAKSKAGHDASVNVAFAYTWKQLQQDEMPPMLEVWHEGRCGRCNRKLTVPTSIASGIGPDCAEMMGA